MILPIFLENLRVWKSQTTVSLICGENKVCIKLGGYCMDKTASQKLSVTSNDIIVSTRLFKSGCTYARVSSNADWQALHTFELKLIKSWELPKSCVKVASKSSLAGMLIIFPNIVYQVKKALLLWILYIINLFPGKLRETSDIANVQIDWRQIRRRHYLRHIR